MTDKYISLDSPEILAKFGDNGKMKNIVTKQGAMVTPDYSAGRTLTASTDLVNTDCGTLIKANHAATPIVLTIQNDTTSLWDDNAVLSAYQAGAALVSFAAGAGVTLRSPVGIPAGTQYGVIGAIKVGTNEWALI